MRYIWQTKFWPQFKWQSEEILPLLSRVRMIQGRLLSRGEALGLDLRRQAHATIVSEEALKTSAIEGEKLNLASIRSSVAKRLGLPTVGLPKTERAIDGLVEVLLDATENYAEPLTLTRLKGWHAALFPTGYSGMAKIRVGRWRKQDPMQVVSGPIGREKVHFEAPPSAQLESEMKQFLRWWDSSLKDPKKDGLLRAAAAHFYFVTIHPFEDGNGRVARALTDMALAQDENKPIRFYSLSSQIMEERNAYYDILENAQHGNGDITEWLCWFLQCLERAMHRSENLIQTVLTKSRFWQQNSGVDMNDRQRKVLNRLLDAGESGFEGGLTTRKYVAMTKVSRATAFREIDDLLKKGLLLPEQGSGRSTHYRIQIQKK